MPNIKFNYLYRDGANYKNYSFAIFPNPQKISIEYLQKIINSKLIEEAWFYADQWQLPDLHFIKWNNEFDHTYHEFESIEYTDDSPNTLLTLAEFIRAIAALKNTF
jgi:hypothetical protein